MLSGIFDHPILIIVHIVLLLLCITVHEYAHARMADRLGDPTPRLQRRLTLNPLAHLDPIGTLLMLFIGFGWGRAVQFDPYNLENPRRDAMKIAFAGPAINIIVALVVSITMQLLTLMGVSMMHEVGGGIALYHIGAIAIGQNLSLAIFNLIPVEPLDGFKIVGGLLSEEQAEKWHSLRSYGPIFLIILLLPIGGVSIISNVLRPIISFLMDLLI